MSALSNNLAEFFIMSTFQPEICALFRFDDDDRRTEEIVQLAHWIQGIPASCEGQLGVHSGPSIMLWLRDASYRKASEPRDQVYGIMDLFPSTLGRQTDYSARISQVFEVSTVGLLRHMDSPSLIMMAGRHRQTLGSLPSWVFEFMDCFNAVIMSMDDDASGGLMEGQRSFSYQGQGQLLVPALMIGRVSSAEAGPSRLDWIDDHGFPKHVRSFLQRWRVSYTRVCGQTQETPSACWKLMVPLLLDTLRAGVWNMDCNVEEAVQVLSDSLWREEDSGTLDWPTGGFIDVLPIYLEQTGIFATNNNVFGNVEYEPPLVDDVLAILPKTPLPVILREAPHVGPNAYEVVKACMYCVGIMHGEAVHAAALAKNGNENNLDGVFQDIILV